MLKRFLATYGLAVFVLVVALQSFWRDEHTIWSALSWLGLIVQAIVLAFAVRLYRASRSPAFMWLMAGCVALVMSQSSWFTLGFSVGFFALESEAYAAWGERAERALELASFVLFAVALSRFHSDHRAGSTPRI